MHFRRPLVLAAGLFLWGAAHAFAAPDLSELVSPIHDFTSTLTATKVNTDELVKISKDYARSYKIKSSRLSYRNPNYFKVDGNIGPLSVIYVIVGNKKYYRYGPIHGEQDVTNAPGKKQGLFDFGILTADQLEDYTWKFVREERVNGAPLDVFELRYKNIKKDPSRRLIWVDPVHKVVVRRSTYNQFRDNVLKMDMRFEDLVQAAPGIWVPTVIKVYNPEGKLGAVSRESDIRINKGVPLSTFDT